jgi:hypothetical protein
MSQRQGWGLIQTVVLVGLLLIALALVRDNLGYPNPPKPVPSVTPAVTESMRARSNPLGHLG